MVMWIVLGAVLLTSCNAAEDKRVITHTITKTTKLYSDTVAGATVVGTLNAGDQVYYPHYHPCGMADVGLTEFGPRKGYVKQDCIASDTVIITHSSVLRNEYGQTIIPDLDEKLDSIGQGYLDFFPLKEGGFWTFAIILGIGIAIFYSIANIDVPIFWQLLAIVGYTPLAIWVAFNIHFNDLTQMDGFLFRLIIILEFLALTILMIMAITASIGKLIGHNFTFKFSIWTTMSIYLIYFGVAYLHSLCDFFFKVAVFVYGVFALFYIGLQLKLMIKHAGISIKGLGQLVLNLLIFALCVTFIAVIMIPMQWVASILFTQLFGALLVVMLAIDTLVFIAVNPGGDYSGSDSWKDHNSGDGSMYEHEISGGLTRGSGSFDNNWYDQDGNAYEETSPGRFRRR